MKGIFRAFIFAAAIGPVTSNAQAVIEGELSRSRPIVMRDGQGFSACGIRAMVLVKSAGETSEVYDFSLQFYAAHLTGLMKAGKQVTHSKRPNDPPKPVIPAPVEVWISKELQGAPLIAQQLEDASDTPGYALGLIEPVDGVSIVLAMAENERMHIGLKYRSNHPNPVVSFRAELKEQDRKLVAACISQLAERWLTALDAENAEARPR